MSKSTQSSGRPPLDFFGFIEEDGLVAVV